jgi:hypothetical protein
MEDARGLGEEEADALAAANIVELAPRKLVAPQVLGFAELEKAASHKGEVDATPEPESAALCAPAHKDDLGQDLRYR